MWRSCYLYFTHGKLRHGSLGVGGWRLTKTKPQQRGCLAGDVVPFVLGPRLLCGELRAVVSAPAAKLGELLPASKHGPGQGCPNGRSPPQADCCQSLEHQLLMSSSPWSCFSQIQGLRRVGHGAAGPRATTLAGCRAAAGLPCPFPARSSAGLVFQLLSGCVLFRHAPFSDQIPQVLGVDPFNFHLFQSRTWLTSMTEMRLSAGNGLLSCRSRAGFSITLTPRTPSSRGTGAAACFPRGTRVSGASLQETFSPTIKPKQPVQAERCRGAEFWRLLPSSDT